MVKLRLKRMGRKRRPFYRIVAMTDNQPRNGRALQELGTYDPVHARFDVNEEAAITWLNDGAQMTPTVHDLFYNKGVLARWRGFEGSDNEAALKKDKPKRRKKLGATVAAPATETETNDGSSSNGKEKKDSSFCPASVFFFLFSFILFFR
ncbi:MAG TPA: 30S ribosomal protein S16, partial [Candidatus Handelsmanbacteria bacterium]|nr:30S ribosomal protein S16 [Candidatus Handelsmanbacteria bacterium]